MSRVSTKKVPKVSVVAPPSAADVKGAGEESPGDPKQRCEGPGCEIDFEPKRSTARFHSATCRQRAARERKSAEAAAVADAKAETGDAEHGLVRAVRQELNEASALDTVDGQLALQVARRIADPETPGISALSKELRSLLAAAKGVANPSPDPASGGSVEPEGDEVAEARRRREEIAAAAAATEAQA